MTKIVIGADHAGFELKVAVKAHLQGQGFSVVDVGTNSADSVDYPYFANRVVEEVLRTGGKGILVCGSGIGVNIAANRHRGIRAVHLCSVEMAKLARQHNDANVACLGARFTGAPMAIKIVDTFLNAKFAGGRHEKRVKMLDA